MNNKLRNKSKRQKNKRDRYKNYQDKKMKLNFHTKL